MTIRKKELQTILDFFEDRNNDEFDQMEIESYKQLIFREEFLEELLAEGERPLKFSDGHYNFLIHKDLEKPGAWRVTAFDLNEEPMGHTTYSSFEKCLDRVINVEVVSLDSIERF